MTKKAEQHPNHFIDGLIQAKSLKNDAALSNVLDVAPPVISKIRHRRIAVSPWFLLRAYDATGLSIEELRQLLYKTETYRRGVC